MVRKGRGIVICGGWFLAGMLLTCLESSRADPMWEWDLKSPRPALSVGGRITETGELMLISADREGLNGYWEARYAVEGGKWVEFSVLRKATGITSPRRSCVVRIEWEGGDGKKVLSPESVNPDYFGEEAAWARPEFPRDKGVNENGWTRVADRYLVPDEAVSATIQLHLRWAPGGSVSWREPRLGPSDEMWKRNVKLAAVHTRLEGGGRSAQENREWFAPLIASAADQGADLVVLPELLNCKGVKGDYETLAEPVPGPSTDYFGKLAERNDCYVVIGILERDDSLIYNVAVLLGPKGEIVGTYRKVTLPREEIAKGITPGKSYPVFETRFGKMGMMVCYDVFHPEVARSLALNGAEVIAAPIWGGNPLLAAARCAENGVYLITSTYTDHEDEWMKTAVWNREGERIVTAKAWDSVVITEVDLNQRTYWHGLGDFQSRIAREAPVSGRE